jgi:hypothetical protein
MPGKAGEPPILVHLPHVPVVPKTAEEKAKLERERKDKRQDCSDYLMLAKDKLEMKRTAWTIAARTIGSAYCMAYETHVKAVESAAKEAALHESIAFGVLTAITVGALGWLGEASKAASSFRKLMAAGLEDTIQTALGEGFDVIQAGVAPTAKTVAKSPLIFQNSLLNSLDDQWKQVLAFFIRVRARLFESELERFDTVTPKRLEAEMNKWLKRNKFMVEPKVQDQKEMQNEIERGIWAKWVPCLKVIIPSGPRTLAVELYEKPGTPVEARLNKLGITAEAGIGKTFGWFTSQPELEKLAAWARSFSPKKFEF